MKTREAIFNFLWWGFMMVFGFIASLPSLINGRYEFYGYLMIGIWSAFWTFVATDK